MHNDYGDESMVEVSCLVWQHVKGNENRLAGTIETSRRGFPKNHEFVKRLRDNGGSLRIDHANRVCCTYTLKELT